MKSSKKDDRLESASLSNLTNGPLYLQIGRIAGSFQPAHRPACFLSRMAHQTVTDARQGIALSSTFITANDYIKRWITTPAGVRGSDATCQAAAREKTAGAERMAATE